MPSHTPPLPVGTPPRPRLRGGVLVGALLCLALAGCRKPGGGARLAASVVQPPAAFAWSGALTPTSVRVVAGLKGPSDSAWVRLDPGPDALPSATSAAFEIVPGGAVVTAEIGGLTPGTEYAYAFEAEGRTLQAGSFRTPEDGPFSFEVAVSGCAVTGSNSPVFDAVRARRPLFFLHLGDMHYLDIGLGHPDLFRRAYGRVLRSPRQAALYADTPLAYVWDDHDFGPNDSDRTAPGRDAVQQVYRELVPHYPLPAAGPVYQAFTVGRVRFILTDLRSMRDPRGLGGARTMMGAEQKAWFKRELLAASRRYPLTVWGSTVPWIGPPSPAADHWGGFPEERREIADFIADNAVGGLVIVAGDAHMVAMDDGSNSDYASRGGAPIPVIQAAALDQTGSVKGGPYSEGAYPVPSTFPPHPGQWVSMEVADDGGPEVCATWTGYRTGSAVTEELVRWSRCFAAPPPVPDLLADSTTLPLRGLPSIRVALGTP